MDAGVAEVVSALNLHALDQVVQADAALEVVGVQVHRLAEDDYSWLESEGLTFPHI